MTEQFEPLSNQLGDGGFTVRARHANQLIVVAAIQTPSQL
ncbi:Uncharacterised protein [Vibrio cholerae]|uniref:Uncharacterized protein n=1 Tax=Vibrio cholerae TaxID=666 RepID=A0A655TLK6_VIBCL|nr:Uncharacterised protein [Vibrio cholerae]CSB36914.1 Uncharacterised protein [Vibrio cholerae]CSC77490.1 Uncharacterised protein [Vibrio cholerae]CSI02061.1 Uncharacterised protein [Vibrio cholerae]